MNKLEAQKFLLKELRALVHSFESLDGEFKGELLDTINTLIGRINCYLTDDDIKLEQLAVTDGLRENG